MHSDSRGSIEELEFPSGSASPMEIDNLGFREQSMEDDLFHALVERVRNRNIAPPDFIDYRQVSQHRLTQEHLQPFKERLHLETVPAQYFFRILDRIVDIHAEFSSFLLEDIHELHELEQLGRFFKSHIQAWVKQPHVQAAFQTTIGSYASPEEARSHFNEFSRRYQASSTEKTEGLLMAIINNRPPNECSLVHAAARKCVRCISFLLEHDLINIHGCDGWGRDFLYGAVEAEDEETLAHLLGFVQRQTLPRTNASEIAHYTAISTKDNNPLKHAIERRWGVGCELIINRLCDFYDDIEPFFDDEMKLGMCAFLSVEFADTMRQCGVNIGNVGMRRSRGKENMTTSWHVAAAENRHGRKFMRWLQKHSGVDPHTTDWRLYTPLHAAADGNTIASIEWLCKELRYAAKKEYVRRHTKMPIEPEVLEKIKAPEKMRVQEIKVQERVKEQDRLQPASKRNQTSPARNSDKGSVKRSRDDEPDKKSKKPKIVDSDNNESTESSEDEDGDANDGSSRERKTKIKHESDSGSDSIGEKKSKSKYQRDSKSGSETESEETEEDYEDYKDEDPEGDEDEDEAEEDGDEYDEFMFEPEDPLEPLEIAGMSQKSISPKIFGALVEHWAGEMPLREFDAVARIFEAICWGAYKATRKEHSTKSKVVKKAVEKCEVLSDKLALEWNTCEHHRRLIEQLSRYGLEGLTNSIRRL